MPNHLHNTADHNTMQNRTYDDRKSLAKINEQYNPASIAPRAAPGPPHHQPLTDPPSHDAPLSPPSAAANGVGSMPWFGAGSAAAERVSIGVPRLYTQLQ